MFGQAVDYDGRTPLFYACTTHEFNTIAELVTFAPELLDMADSNGDTPLHVCCANNFIDCAKLLLQTEADPDIPNCDGHTPASICTTAEGLEALFDNGANLFCTDAKQRSLMFNAAANGDIGRVAFLLEIDVEQIMLDAADLRGDSPLHAACCNGRPEVVELLLSYAARPDMKNQVRCTNCSVLFVIADCFFHWACFCG